MAISRLKHIVLPIIGTLSILLALSVTTNAQNEYQPNLLLDVSMDSAGNLYVIGTHWSSDHPIMNVFDSEGKENSKFNLRLPNFCCDPFPLRVRCSEDGFTYICLPGMGGLIRGTDLQFVRIDSEGHQDDTFGDNGVLKLPTAFKLQSFDISPQGEIWVMDTEYTVHRFDDDGMLVKVRKLVDIFPDEMLGGRFREFKAASVFALDENLILVTGNIIIELRDRSIETFFAVLELDRQGKMIKSQQWKSPWFSKSPGEPSFFTPLHGKSFTRQNGTFGTIIGFPEGIRGEPDPRRIVILDWSMKDGFHFYNLTELEIPGEIFLGYDLNQVFITKDSERTYLYFPFSDRHEVLVASYDEKGKINKKFKLKAFD